MLTSDHRKTHVRCGYKSALGSAEDGIVAKRKAIELSPDGTFTCSCEWCGALHFECEKVAWCLAGKKQRLFSRCCRGGSFSGIPLLPPAPPVLAELLSGCATEAVHLPSYPGCLIGRIDCSQKSLRFTHKQLNNFEHNIRSYNSALSFVSFTDSHAHANSDDKMPPPKSASAPPVYVLHGRAYHVAGNLVPAHGKQPKYAQ
eukprot:10309633-Karenia_brevis.AAC.1